MSSDVVLCAAQGEFSGDHCEWNSLRGWAVTWSQREVRERERENLREEESERERETEKEKWRKGEGRTEGQREGDVSWVQKVNRVPDCSMLSAGRGLQLGQTHGGIHTIPQTGMFISGKEAWLLFTSLFIFISLPQGTAWPYGKRLAKTLPLLLSFVLLILSLCLALCSLFQRNPASALSPSPSSLISFKSTTALCWVSQWCKKTEAAKKNNTDKFGKSLSLQPLNRVRDCSMWVCLLSH